MMEERPQITMVLKGDNSLLVMMLKEITRKIGEKAAGDNEIALRGDNVAAAVTLMGERIKDGVTEAEEAPDTVRSAPAAPEFDSVAET